MAFLSMSRIPGIAEVTRFQLGMSGVPMGFSMNVSAAKVMARAKDSTACCLVMPVELQPVDGRICLVLHDRVLGKA